MMKKQIMMGVVMAGGMVGAAQAELTANVGVTSNYVFRGVTQTDDGPAVQGGIDFTHESGIYAGAWASNVEDNTGDDGFEYDLYVGYNFRVNDKVGFDVGYITYQYSGTNAFTETDELFVGVSFMDFSATYYDGDPDVGRDYSYIDLKYTMALPQDINLHLHYGNLDVSGGSDAEDASIGVSKNIAGFDLGLTFTTFDPDNGNDENELFVTATKSFEIFK